MSVSPPTPPPNVSKKRGPLFWVLIGVASFLLLVVVAFGTIAYIAFQTAQKTTGMDAETMKKYPKFAAVKMQVATDPDCQILAEDMEKAEVKCRHKKTGQEFLVKVDDANRLTRIPLQPAETK